MILLDCTLRDGGYYNSWDFSEPLINEYLQAMKAAGVDYIELGLRSLINQGFKGACAYTTDEFLRCLQIPTGIKLGVMINATELLGEQPLEKVLQVLFPENAENSPIKLVRIACHVPEFALALPAVNWLKKRGFIVGFNLMQISECSRDKVLSLAKEAAQYPIDTLYFADSMGCMTPCQITQTIGWIRKHWQGALGVHTHDNLGLALSNTLRALEDGATWVDSTVTGMGRGPGNARTEELAIEIANLRKQHINLIPLMTIIRQYFKPMQHHYGWGTNPYYYLAGKYRIHPTYIQQMLSDSRFSEEDVLAVIEHLRREGGTKFSPNTLNAARNFYKEKTDGAWQPKQEFINREILLLGTGPGVSAHRKALEQYIRQHHPLVLAFNTQQVIDSELIDYRVACHPVRLLADCQEHTQLPQPLITPYSIIPPDIQTALAEKEVCDFGISIQEDTFKFFETHCVIPSSMVVAYALAIATSGKAKRILMAGFDGYGAGDPRNIEMNSLLSCYKKSNSNIDLIAVTPSQYQLVKQSIYSLGVAK